MATLDDLVAELTRLQAQVRELARREQPGGFTAGSVPFADTDGRLTQDAGLVYDAATNILTQAAWAAPTLSGTWANYGGAYQTARYFRDSLGIVHLEGLVANASSISAGGNSVISVLPSGYRPPARLIFEVECYFATTGAQAARIDVESGGEVRMYNQTATTQAISYVSLSGITFRTS